MLQDPPEATARRAAEDRREKPFSSDSDAPGGSGSGVSSSEMGVSPSSRLRYLQAATLIEDAIKLRPVTHDLTSERMLRLYRFFWRNPVQWFLNTIVLVLLVMPAFERPAFTVQADESSEGDQSLLAPWPSTEIVELFILGVIIAVDIVPRWMYSLKGTWRNKSEAWFLAYNAIVALSVIDVVIRFIVDGLDSNSGYFRFSRPLRVYMMVYRYEPVRITLRNIVRSFYEVIHLFALFFTLVVLFSAVGVLLFDGTPEQASTFPNTLEGTYQLLLLTTTCNHPDVYIPAYNYNWASFLFFMLYSTVSQIFFLNLMLSVIVSTWRTLLKADVARKMTLRREALRGAFAVLANGKEYVQKEDFLKMMQVYKPAWPKSKLPFYWTAVDTQGIGRVTLPEFMLVLEALEITVERVSKLWRFVPVKVSAQCREITRTKIFNAFIDIVIVIVSLWPIVEVELRHANYQTISDGAAYALEFGFLIFFTVELAAKLLADRSLSLFMSSPKNKFDAFLLVISWILGFFTIGSGRAGGIVKISMMVRLLRVLFSIIGGFKKFAWLFDALLNVVPTFLSILLAHVVWMYLFSVLGIEIFGDVVRKAAASGVDHGYGLVTETDYWKLSYHRLGYGSFPEAMAATWVLVIVNNWHVIIQAYVVATGNKAARIFFVCFWIIDVICTMAVLIAALLEMVMRQWDDKTKYDERQVEVEKRLKQIVSDTDEEGYTMSGDERRASVDIGRSGRMDVGLIKPNKIEQAEAESQTWISRRTKQFTSMMQRMVLPDLNEQDYKDGGAEEVTSALGDLYKVYTKPADATDEKKEEAASPAPLAASPVAAAPAAPAASPIVAADFPEAPAAATEAPDAQKAPQ